jgi:site-specific recombinase XerD
MNLRRLIEQYIAFQQSLGTPFLENAAVLRAFGRALGARANVASVRPQDVEAFLGRARPVNRSWHSKLSRLRSFFQYAVSRGYIPAAPLPAVIPKRPAPFVPYIFSPDELRRLLCEADADRRKLCLETATIRVLILLLYGTGLRLSEALNLTRADVDLQGSVLTVRHTKFGKTRLVPFGPQLGEILTQHAARGQSLPAEAPFFTTRLGTPVNRDTFHQNFRLYCERANIRRSDGGRYQPRIHDLRHTFAVHRLTSWYRQGADVQRLVHLLSVYLGHTHLRHTQVYLSMTPALLTEASACFERYAGKEATHD